MYAFPMSPDSDLRKDVQKVQARFGYRLEPDAAFNSMKVGLKIFERDPEEFMKILATN